MSYLAARGPAAASMQRVLDAGATDDLAAAHRGVEAELATAAVLERLGPGWRLLHSLPVGPGPAVLHSLVVGPHGVFAVQSLPAATPVVDVVDGRATVSPYGSDEAVAEVRQLAQRVLAGLRRRLGTAVDVPAVQPVLCVTRDSPGGHAEVVELARLQSHLESRPRCLPAAAVRHLHAVAAETRTWDAPGTEHCSPDLRARYDAVARPPGELAAAPDDVVVPGQVTGSRPPELAAHGPGLRTASVLLVLLGMASMGTWGVLSVPTLAFGGWAMHHYGGFRWVNGRDQSLLMVGMVLAALPLPVFLLFLSAVVGSRG